MASVPPATVLDPRVRALLRGATAALHAAGVPYAVGGGVAVAAHGFPYQTHDLDIFFDPEDRHRAMQALVRSGLRPAAVFEPVHYALAPRNPLGPVRIDAMFPWDDPELSAVHLAVDATIGRTRFRVFPIDLLVVAKFLANRPGKDHPHIAAMIALGLVPKEDVEARLRQIEPDAVPSWQFFLETLRVAQPAGQRAWRHRMGPARRRR